MTTVRIIHPRYTCGPCEDADVRLYHFGRDNGATIEVAHGCEHYIRERWPDVPAWWLAQQAVLRGADCIGADRFGEPCHDCGTWLTYNVQAAAIDSATVCVPCGAKRYGDRLPEYLIVDERPARECRDTECGYTDPDVIHIDH